MREITTIVVDTSVLVDIFLESRPRHSSALRLADYLAENRVRVKVPMHALFEIACAINNEKLFSPLRDFRFSKRFSECVPFEIETVPIDQSFLKKYFRLGLPYLKAGDLIFVAMAKVDGAVLITEDKNQYSKAKEIGVDTCQIEEFIDQFVE